MRAKQTYKPQIYKTPLISHNMKPQFKNKNKKNKQTQEQPQIVTRVKLPKGEEILGIIEERHGGNKMKVSCLDGKERVCRVPGRLRRKLWLRPNDVVIIQPWELDKDKGDVIFKYRPNQIEWLRRHGHLEKEKSEF